LLAYKRYEWCFIYRRILRFRTICERE